MLREDQNMDAEHAYNFFNLNSTRCVSGRLQNILCSVKCCYGKFSSFGDIAMTGLSACQIYIDLSDDQTAAHCTHRTIMLSSINQNIKYQSHPAAAWYRSTPESRPLRSRRFYQCTEQSAFISCLDSIQVMMSVSYLREQTRMWQRHWTEEETIKVI